MNTKPRIGLGFHRLCSIVLVLVAASPFLRAGEADPGLYPKSLGVMKGILAVLAPQHNSSNSVQENYLQRLKAYRYVCGVPYEDLTWSKELEDYAYHACLAFTMNKEMSHGPKKPDGMSDDAYAKAQRGAGGGNLFAGLTHPVACVDGWMNDSVPGPFNAVGHRRWCLNPAMLKTAFATKDHFAVMYAHDGSRSSVPDWDYVAYPTRGYMPISLFGGGYAWSVSLNMGKYATPSQDAVKVTIQPMDGKLGDPLKLDCLTVENQGFGSGPAIMFRPESFAVKADTRYMVTIAGLQNKSRQPAQIQYLVHFIDVAKAPDSPESQLTINAFVRKRLDAINALPDHIEKWAALTDLLSDKLLSSADASLAKEVRDGIADLLKDPVVRREEEAARQYRVIADLEQHVGKSKSKRVAVVTSYRDLASYLSDTRAGKRAAADFERLNKDLALPLLAVAPAAPGTTAPPPTVATTPASKATAPQPAPAPAKAAVSPAALEQWQARLIKKLDALAKSGAKLRLHKAGQENCEIRGADDRTLTVRIQGNDLPMPWKQLSLGDRAALAKEAVKDDDLEALLIAAVFQLADGDAGTAEELFGKAAIKDANAVKSAKAGLASQ